MNIDVYASLGYALELLAQSEYHKVFETTEYFDIEIIPPIWNGQARFYLTDTGIPTAMVTWAWLSESVMQDVINTGRALEPGEWHCGDQLFFNDWVTPYRNIRDVVRDMTHNVFPNEEVAVSLRRHPDGTVRRVNRWTGKNLRTKLEGAA